jgi:hypothetical protein
MELLLVSLLLIVLGLYFYSAGATGRDLTKKAQPFLDSLFGLDKHDRKP